jgi:hypothetical protein
MADLRVSVTYTWAVNGDGSQGDLVEQTAPRYSDADSAVASYDYDALLSHVGLKASAEDENQRLRALLAEHGIEVPGSVNVAASSTSQVGESVN